MADPESEKKSDSALATADASHAQPGPPGQLDAARMGLPPEALRRKLARRWKANARSQTAHAEAGHAGDAGPASGAAHGLPSLSEIKTEVSDGAEILWELSRLSEFHVLSGTFEGELDIGKAAYYCQLVHPGGVLGMLEFNAANRGSNRVHLVLNLYHKTFEVRAATLELKGFHSPEFTSRSSRLDGVIIRGHSGAADVTVGGASMNDAVFIKGKDHVAAASVGLHGLRIDGSYASHATGAGGQQAMSTGAAAMRFDEAHVVGLRYPGMPPTDVNVKQAGLHFDALWTTLGAKSAAPGALAHAPELLPKDSRVQIELDGLAAAGKMADGALAGGGGFEHFHVRLVGADGGELAAIAVDGFHAAATGSGGAGSIDRLTVKGEPRLIQSLLRSEQVQAQPSVRQAMDVIRGCGIQPVVGGALTLQHVGMVAGRDGTATAKGDLDAHLVVPELGALDLSLRGFVVHVQAGAPAGGFERFTARYADPNGKELAYVELDGAAGSQGPSAHAPTGGARAAGVNKFLVRGDLAGLVKVAESSLAKLPPQVRAALDAVRELGLKGEVSGGLSGAAGDGHAEVAGDLRFNLDAGPECSVSLALKGFRGDAAGGTAGASFTRLEAQLLSRDKEAAAFAIDAADEHGGPHDRALTFTARKVALSGDATHLATLLRAVEKKASVLPRAVKSACDVARAYSLAATGEVTLANVVAGEDSDGGTSLRADLSAKVLVPAVGELDASVTGFESHAQKNGARAVAFQRLAVTLRRKDGAEAAYFAAEAQAQEEGGAGAHGVKFRARRLEARGDVASLDALYNAAGSNLRLLPSEVKAAFATVAEFGVDGKGEVTLENVEVSGDKDGSRAKADLVAGFELSGAGRVNIVVRGFEGAVTKTSKEVRFDSFDAALRDAKGTQTARLVVEGSTDRVATPAPGAPAHAPDMNFHARRVEASGSAREIAALFGGVQQHLKALPPQVVAAFDAVREYGRQFPAMANISLGDVDLGSSDGEVVARGDLSARVEVPDVGTLEARLKGNRAGDRPGFESLDLALTDKMGGAPASLHVGGVVLGGDGKSATIGSIQAQGDGARLHAVLDPKVQALLPPVLAHSLALLDGDRLSTAMYGLSVKQDANGRIEAGAETIVITAAVHFVDKQGAVYACPDASLMMTGARVQLGSDRKPERIDAAAMSATGHFTSTSRAGSIEGTATLRTGTVHVVMGPGGAPLRVEASDIEASGDIRTTQSPEARAPVASSNPNPGKSEKGQALQKMEPVVEGAARLVKSADVHTRTPLFPGKYGKNVRIGVPSGAMLDVNIVARNNALAGGTDVRFVPPLDLPLWLSMRGVNLEVKGREGVLKTDLKGFFDLNVSKYATGKKSLSLDLTTLVKQVMDHLQQAIADAKEPSARDVASDAQWLGDKHEHWAADTQQDANRAAGKSDAARRKVAERDAGEEPRSPYMSDLGTSKGMDVMATTGTADLELATEKSATTVDNVTLAAGNDIHLHGQSSGGGSVNLSADEVVTETGGNRVEASGINSGNVKVKSGADGTHVQFDSFSLKQLRWDVQPPV